MLHKLRVYARYFDLVWEFVIRDLKGRYIGASMGMFWTVIHPLVMILIYTLIFSRMMHARVPGIGEVYGYSIYLCAGLLPWNAFGESVLRSTTAFIDNADLLKKAFIPKPLFLLYIQIVCIINIFISFSIFFIFLILIGHYPTIFFLIIPFLLILQQIFSLGLSFLFSTLHVFIRDTAQLVGVIMQLWFWITPIMYFEKILPEAIQKNIFLNPWAIIARIYHDIIFLRVFPGYMPVVYFGMVTVITLILGMVIFQLLRKEIVDKI
jgi:lipopolysaccharide transport system permease protein